MRNYPAILDVLEEKVKESVKELAELAEMREKAVKSSEESKVSSVYMHSTFSLTLSQTSPDFFTCLQHKSFENTVGKGEIARNEQFLLFPQCFLPFKKILPFSLNLKLSFANSFSLEESKICRLGKG